MEVLRVFQGRLRSVPRDPKGYLKEEFQGSFKDVLRKFQGCLKKVSIVFQENFKRSVNGVSRMFQ